MSSFISNVLSHASYSCVCPNPECHVVHNLSAAQNEPLTCECGQVLFAEAPVSAIVNSTEYFDIAQDGTYQESSNEIL